MHHDTLSRAGQGTEELAASSMLASDEAGGFAAALLLQCEGRPEQLIGAARAAAGGQGGISRSLTPRLAHLRRDLDQAQ